MLAKKSGMLRGRDG